MPPLQISFRLVPNVMQGQYRAIGMLEGHQDLCAETLLGLSEDDARYHRFSMGHWASGHDKPKKRFHRFDGTDFFVFKYVAQQQRFYGFLYHPLPQTNQRLWLCVLTTYAQKKKNETDQADLARVKQWMELPATKAAIRLFYPDEKKKDQKP